MGKVLLVSMLVLFVGACALSQTVDDLLLVPDRDESGNVIYEDPAGNVLSEPEVLALPEEEQKNYSVRYIRAKTNSEINESGLNWEIYGIPIGSVLTLAAAGWWWIRRKKRPAKTEADAKAGA